MYDLKTINGKTYKRIPERLNGEVIGYDLIEVTGPAVPPASLFTESSPINNVCAATADTADLVELQVPEPALEQFSEEGTLFLDSDSEDSSSVSQHEELVAPQLLAKEGTHEETDPVEAVRIDESETLDDSGSEDDKEGSEASEDQSKVLESEEESSLAKEHSLSIAFYALNLNDYDENLRSLDNGWYLINVDGHYVYTLQDIHKFCDGKTRRLHFSKNITDVKRMVRVDRVPVCYKPQFKTLKKIQVRTGPRSKFPACGILPANTQVVVLQEGLLDCELSLVEEWMNLHLPKELCVSFGKSMQPTFADYIMHKCIIQDGKEDIPTDSDLFEAFAEYALDESEAEMFLKAIAAANRKVKVSYMEDGSPTFGWVSKKKNSGTLLRRIFGTSAPQVVISEVDTQFKDTDFTHPEDFEGTFIADSMNYWRTHSKTTTIKYGDKKEMKETHQTRAPMSLYRNLAKREIASILGASKTRFTVDWQGSFKRDRFRGIEKEEVLLTSKEGTKKRIRTGYYIPDRHLTVTFQRFYDASAFLRTCLDNTRFSSAELSLDPSFENLQTVDAKMCPEWRKFSWAAREKTNNNYIEKIASENGVEFVYM